MIKFIKERDADNPYDNTDIVMSTDEITLTEIVQEFQHFLLACGYVFDGDLDFVEEESLTDEDE